MRFAPHSPGRLTAERALSELGEAGSRRWFETPERLAAQSEPRAPEAHVIGGQAELRRRDVETPHSQFRRARECSRGSIASWLRPLWRSVFHDAGTSADRNAS